jgi:two-component system phosphate regulon sensor histidine kinase PhoR
MAARKVQISISSISVVLMLLAILAIVVFQGYWLRKNYRDELENLHIRTNVLFSETAQQYQIEKLQLDTNFKIRLPAHEPGMNAAYQTFRRSDSGIRKQRLGSVIVSLNKTFRTFRDDDSGRIDSLHIVGPPGGIMKMARPNQRVMQFLQGLENPKDSLTVKEVSDRYAQVLKRENIDIAFAVVRGPAEPFDERMPPDFGTDNIITLGFNYAYSFSLELQNTIPYVLKKLTPQILVSLLLVGLTIFSFVLMYRNLLRQRKLTRLKNDFISNITHELKTPIATVSVAIEALRNFNALHDPQRTEEYLDISANELQRLSLLVDKVLKLSMFEKQQIELKEETFDFKELVEEVVASMRLQFEKYKAAVNIQLHGEDFTITADRMHITSVIFNLLDNALKYSKPHLAIQINLASLPQFIEMSITDNGIGISSEYQKKIFDKFFRVPTGDTHNVKGYGLGLSYVAYIMDRHKGIISVESQPGIGTRFTTKLPKTP